MRTQGCRGVVLVYYAFAAERVWITHPLLSAAAAALKTPSSAHVRGIREFCLYMIMCARRVLLLKWSLAARIISQSADQVGFLIHLCDRTHALTRTKSVKNIIESYNGLCWWECFAGDMNMWVRFLILSCWGFRECLPSKTSARTAWRREVNNVHNNTIGYSDPQ